MVVGSSVGKEVLVDVGRMAGACVSVVWAAQAEKRNVLIAMIKLSLFMFVSFDLLTTHLPWHRNFARMF